MSASRYPDTGRYPRDRSPPYRERDRRPSNFGGGYPPRGSESFRPNAEPGGFAREIPKGPKSLGDAPRGPPVGPPSSTSAAPRDDRSRGFAGRGEATPLRTAPPLSSGPGFPHNSQNSWRADRDRDRDFDRRERRPTPPRRSPIRDTRDPRDQRDFGPRDVDVSRARRNSRDGPPSAGSTYSDPPPLGTASSYRGGGIGRGRGGFAGRGRNFHNDDRDRHHDSRDRPPERTYRPRSRTPPRRQERDIREDRDFDRRERDDRRFPREYDSYIGPAGAAKPGLRALDTHRGSVSDLRHLPGTPTGPTPHSSHHASPSDRLGPQGDTYSRRSSVAIDPLSAKDPRREPGKDEALLASRAEASRERYAPRASSPPASIPAFGGSNVWRAPISDSKPSAAPVAPSKPAQSTPAPTNAPVGSVTPATPVTPVKAAVIPTAPKAAIPPGLSTLPPTGPKADRPSDRPLLGDAPKQENRTTHPAPARMEPPSIPPPFVPSQATDTPGSDSMAAKIPTSPQMAAPPKAPSMVSSATPTAPTAPSGAAKSPPQGPAARPRVPPTAPQAAMRVNVSPSFSRATLPHYASRDASPGANSSAFGPRGGSGGGSAIHTSPQSLPANIPTGPKADRTPMAPRPLPPYPQSDRPGFPPARGPLSGGPKSMQWVRPGFNSNRPIVPTKREFPAEDRERSFGTTPKAPRLEHSVSATPLQRNTQAKSVSPSFSRLQTEPERPRERAVSAERPVAPSPKPTPIETRRYSDVVMAEASPRMAKPPMSAASSAPEALQDSDDDLDLDEDDFAESEAKYNKERARLEAKRVDLSVPHLRATTPLQEIVLLSCLNVEHLPQAQPDVVSVEETSTPLPQEQEESRPSPVQVRLAEPMANQPLTESITADLPTPKAEESEDVEMEDKEETAERTAAPATMALRLRRENSSEQETLPDLTSLPYLGSGPPTPLSDIGQDRPNLSDDIMNAIRSKLRKSIEPELNTDQILELYAAAYREWRLAIRPFDEEREHDDQDRQPSAEPTLKAVTPDVQNAAMTGILDGSLAPTGRRSHASRWATELDLEAVIKESLKTAEEEKLGKKDKEPRKAMADPEKEADLPLELTEAEAQRRRFIDTNFQREPGTGIFVFHYEPPEDDFTPDEHRVMVQNYKDQYAKKWGKLAEVLYKELGTERTYKDCINHYYATKWGREYKGKLRKPRAPRKRGGAVGRGRGAIANMDRPEGPGEDGLPLPVTETGRPRRHAAPKFGPTEVEFDPITGIPVPGRARRQTDADDTQEKAMRRGKTAKDKVGRKAKNTPLAAAPMGSPVKVDRKEKSLGVKMEDDLGKRPMGDMPMPMPLIPMEDQMLLAGDLQQLSGMSGSLMDRPKTQAGARPGPSSYWSVSELQDFDKNVAHFGTDWIAIANHMGTKTHTMIKNQYLRHVESGKLELEQVAKEADARRERGDDLGPPPTPTPAPKRRYESTQPGPVRPIAPTPEHGTPPPNPLGLSKASPPLSTPSSRFSTIAQAPMQSKPMVPPPGYSTLPETSLASVPSIPPQQSPPAPPQRAPPQHHHQHSMSQHKSQPPGPRAGYFSEDLPPRFEARPPSQSSSNQQPHRPLQQHAPPQPRAQEQHQSPLYRGLHYQEREGVGRSEVQQEHEAQRRFHEHTRRISQGISQEMSQHRPFAPGGAPPIMPPVRSNSGLRSPEHRPLPFSHSRHPSQAQSLSQPASDVYSPSHSTSHGAQQLPSRSTILTPPVKEEPRNPPPASLPPAQPQAMLHTQLQHPQRGPPPMQNTPPPATTKPAAEPRKSNLMSLLNDTDPEEPRRKKPSEQGPPSHTSTPLQSAPIAPPPSTTQSYSSSSRRPLYDDSLATQSPYTRPSSYAQPSSLPAATSNRSIDLTDDKPPVNRPSLRDSWQSQQPFHRGLSQTPQLTSHSSTPSGLPQPPNVERIFGNHRSVFSQHNTPRQNPTPPPLAGFNNSPNPHSRTSSISGPPGSLPRHGIPSTTAAQHAQALSASSQILQPNPYAQVDPPGSGVPPAGPMGMRPSPHLSTSHIAQQQRDSSGRNDHSQASNANLSYSNPQTPNEHPEHPFQGLSRLTEPYRPRDPRDAHGFDPRHSDRDTSRELSQRTEYMREQLSNPSIRATGPPMREDIRYQPQDRGYLSQRSQTPLSRSEHGQPPPLQHPPHSSLGVANHSLYGQRPPEESQHRFMRDPRDRSMTDRILEEQAQAQHQAVLNRDEHMRREAEQSLREREMRERDARDAHYRDSIMRGRQQDLRGPPQQQPSSGPGSIHDPRPPAGPMDWVSGVRHPQDRGGPWQR
jgi:serine/arginine repetitive matrix protein 2